jgi:heterodisulfide reductase subunit B
MENKNIKLHYYPGCTLKEKTTNLDDSTRKSMEILGYELKEPDNWTCCGAEFPLNEEKIIGLTAPARIFRQVELEGGSKVVTVCSFCYNVLKRTNIALGEDPLKYKRINAYLKDDIKIDHTTKKKTTDFPEYQGNVRVLHLLEFIRDEIGYEKIRSLLKRDLSNLKVVPYYGCRLLRPKGEVGIDEPDDPFIFEEFLENIGCKVIDFPFKQECCGSYLSVSLPEAATEASYNILRSAQLNGADALALSCPLCYYNLDRRQDKIKEKFLDFTGMPILFFTQLLAWGLGADEKILGLDQHYYPPYSVLGIDKKSEVKL